MDGVQRSTSQGFGGDVWFARWDTKLIKRVCKKADSTTADRAIIAQLCTVSSRMKPVFKDVVCIGATFSSKARSHFFHVGASNACVGMSARISADCFFSSVGKGADSPVVDETFCAGDDLRKKN